MPSPCSGLLGAIAQPEAWKQLTALDRIGLLTGAFTMFRAGRLEARPMLNALKILEHEADSLVWSAAVGVLNRLVDAFAEEAPAIKGFVASLLAPLKKRLGWAPSEEGESEDDILLRPGVLSLLCRCEDAETRAEAVSRTETHLCTTHPAPPLPVKKGKVSFGMAAAFNQASCPGCGLPEEAPQAGVRGVALRWGLATKGALWSRLAARHGEATDAEEKDQLTVALMGHADRAVVEDWAVKALAGNLARMEWQTMFDGMSRNSFHKTLAWDELVKHWDTVYQAWGQSQFTMKRIIALTMHSADPKVARDFFATHPCDVARQSIARDLEAIATDSALRQRAAAEIRTVLQV